MGLRSALARHAVRRVHVLLVEVPGWSATRMRAERELRRRLWTPAQSPADADALLVCGVPGPELEAVCDRVWDQLPGPRARTVAKTPGDVMAALDEAAASLLDEGAQRHDSRVRSAETAAPDQGAEDDDGAATDEPDHGDMNHGDMNHGDMNHGDMNHGDMNHGDMNHGDMNHGDMNHGDMNHSGMDHGDMNHSGMDHGDMDHSGMDMPMPGGIGLAEGGPDRDGLDLDVLNVPLGPVLPHWPAGLVLHCALQGDVITEAKVEVLNAGEAPPPDTRGKDEAWSDARERCVKRCDSAGRLLALSGAADLSARAFRIRDGLLEGNAPAGAAKELERLARQIKRSRMLAWSLKEPAGVWDALTQWLEEAAAAAAGNDDAGSTAAETNSPVSATERGRPDSLAEQVRGLDLAAARLVVATVDMDLAAPHPEVAHGG